VSAKQLSEMEMTTINTSHTKGLNKTMKIFHKSYTIPTMTTLTILLASQMPILLKIFSDGAKTL
jgi:hypothetical protein